MTGFTKKNTMLTAIVAIAAFLVANAARAAEPDLSAIRREIATRHDEAVKRLRDWIAQPSIAAENLGYPEGARIMAQLAKDAGFQKATVIDTDGKPGVFATLDAGAAKLDLRLVPDRTFAGAVAAMSFVEYLYELAK